MEASVVPQTCIPSITLTENRIKASAEYFEEACKAGPWVSNPILDVQLSKFVFFLLLYSVHYSFAYMLLLAILHSIGFSDEILHLGTTLVA